MVRNVHPRSKEPTRPNLIAFRMIIPEVPKNKREKALLEEDVQRMDCHSLLERLWYLQDEEMVKKLTIA